MMALTLASRNLWKNRRRSLATLLAIAIGFAAVNLFAGYIHVTYQSLKISAIHGEGLGHVTIARRGYFKQGSLNPEKYLFSQSDLQRLEALLQDPDVAMVSPRLPVNGLVSNGRVSTIFIAEGEVPALANQLRGTQSRMPKQDPQRSESGLVSKELAEMLGVKAGGSLVLLSSTLAGQTNALDMDVQAVWDTGMAATNDKLLKLPLAFVQKLLDTDGASRVVVLLKNDEASADEYRQRVLPRLQAAGFDVEIKTWVELSSFYQQVKNLFDMIFLFLFSIVFVVVLMSIVNTLSMSVMERVREIGTLRALGMKKGGIVWLFAVEGFLLGVAGCVVGSAGSTLMGKLINMANFTYTPPSSSSAVSLYVAIQPGMLLFTTLALALVAMLAAFWPARHAAQIEIVDALGHV